MYTNVQCILYTNMLKIIISQSKYKNEKNNNLSFNNDNTFSYVCFIKKRGVF